MREKEKLLELKKKLAEQQEHLKKLEEHMYDHFSEPYIYLQPVPQLEEWADVLVLQ